MKTKQQFNLLLLSLLTIVLIRCTPNQDLKSTTKEIISQGKWSVNYFYSGQNQTSVFSNDQFVFSSNGTFKCLHDTIASFNGTWAIIHDVSRNEVLILNCDVQQANLKQLNTQWNVDEKNTSELNMHNGSNLELQLKRQ